MQNSDEIIEIYLNSATADAFPSQYPSNAVFHIPNITIDKDEKALISVKNCVFPYSWYNITTTQTVSIIWPGSASSPYTWTIVPGFYTVS